MGITREMKMQMFEMHLDGKSPFEIAKETGCSEEEVANTLNINLCKMKFHNKWVFPELRAWMHVNNVTIQELANMCGVRRESVYNWFSERTDITKRHVDKILRATGMTYEEAFGDPRKTE